MGVIKRAIPKRVKNRVLSWADEKMPEDSFIRKNSANAISAAGAGLVWLGTAADRAGYRKTGFVMRATGNAADDVDGDWSRHFKLDGKTGALVDASLDKLKAMAEVYTLWKHTESMTPEEAARRKVMLGFVIGKHSLNAALNTFIQLRGGEAASSKAGKINMWMDGIYFGSEAVRDTTDSEMWLATSRVVSAAAFTGGVIFGGASTIGYARQAWDVALNPPVSTPEPVPVEL